ncbi:MAG: T9SS type A sorting domain-containing protein, partial [Saprospiraceae bacterium]
GDRLFIVSGIRLDAVIISNLLGQRLKRYEKPGTIIETGDMEAGVYLISFQSGEIIWTTKFIKQ